MKAPSVAAILFFCAALAPAFAPALSKDSQNSTPVATATPIVYRNTQYGFCFRLPADWKGYKIVTVPGVRVPELLIQHPKWTADDPRPEIPIMVFTREQWKLGESSDMNWNVAGLEPTEIGRNQSYVFAQPPGWIESEDAEGMDEVRTLMLQNPFEAPCGPPIVYHNAQYDFCFRLPASWKGYTIVTDKWSGGIAGTGDNPKMMQRPLILIRNPEWTEEDPWQDIPIMVFTRAQWRVKEKNGVILSAAGVDVGAIGQNSAYVFTQPPRWLGYATITGFREVQNLMTTHPFQAPCGKTGTRPAH